MVEGADWLRKLFPQGVVFIFQHSIIPVHHSLHRQICSVHHTQGFQYIFLAEGACFIGGHHHIANEVVVALVRQAGQRQHGIGTVVNILAVRVLEARGGIVGIMIMRLDGFHTLGQERLILSDAQIPG